MPALDTIKERMTAYEALKRDFKKNGGELIKEAFTEFFIENPEIKLIAWQQYTPYFNDGDVCRFRIGEGYYTIKDDITPSDLSSPYQLDEKEHMSATADAVFYEFFHEVSRMKEILEDVFGDGANIYVTKDGFTIEEYTDHD